MTDECKSTFTAIKTKQEHAFAIMKIKDRKEIVLEKSADPLPDHTQETNEKVFNQMKEDILNLGEPCYIIFDVRFQRKSGFMKDVVGYIFWYVILLCIVKKNYVFLTLLKRSAEKIKINENDTQFQSTSGWNAPPPPPLPRKLVACYLLIIVYLLY